MMPGVSDAKLASIQDFFLESVPELLLQDITLSPLSSAEHSARHLKNTNIDTAKDKVSCVLQTPCSTRLSKVSR